MSQSDKKPDKPKSKAEKDMEKEKEKRDQMIELALKMAPIDILTALERIGDAIERIEKEGVITYPHLTGPSK